MEQPLFSSRLYFFLFLFLGIVYIPGLFVPLMDNDAAHHANIALRMFLTGDYLNLIDHNGDYLDKPHFFFWTSALSYHIFGVTSFAYKFPSFLFTILGVYSIYRLGKVLYNNETGRLAALIAASSFGFLLTNNDVRMDAILVACVSVSTWQLVALFNNKKRVFVFGAALGLAIGFMTKGVVGFILPFIAFCFYALYKKEWKTFLHFKWVFLFFLFFLFISPVLYCYYQQFNLHPEKIIRGKNNINGLAYIFLNQSVDRLGGKMGTEGDPLFFFHTFFWFFAPWGLITLVALFSRIHSFLRVKKEWLTIGSFLLLLLLISFSKYQLPHYLLLAAPWAAVFSADYFLSFKKTPQNTRCFFATQLFISLLILVFFLLLSYFFFSTSFLIVGGVLFILLFVFVYKLPGILIKKSILVSVFFIGFLFLFLSFFFYPSLLRYQAGRPLVDLSATVAKPKDVYFFKNVFSSSYNFYSASLRQEFNPDDSILLKKPFWLYYDKKSEIMVDSIGLIIGRRFLVSDYEITRLKKNFILPKTRPDALSVVFLVEVLGKK